MSCVEEIINIPILTERLVLAVDNGRIADVITELVLQSRVESHMDLVGRFSGEISEKETRINASLFCAHCGRHALHARFVAVCPWMRSGALPSRIHASQEAIVFLWGGSGLNRRPRRT